MAREQLYINNVYIPLSSTINAALTKSITDIEEPGKRKSTFSKTTKLPLSKHKVNHRYRRAREEKVYIFQDY